MLPRLAYVLTLYFLATARTATLEDDPNISVSDVNDTHLPACYAMVQQGEPLVEDPVYDFCKQYVDSHPIEGTLGSQIEAVDEAVTTMLSDGTMCPCNHCDKILKNDKAAMAESEFHDWIWEICHALQISSSSTVASSAEPWTQAVMQ